jgi:phage-related protein
VSGALRKHHGSHSVALDSNAAEIFVHRVFSPGQFRVIYIAKLKDEVFVLHCFQKKSQKTPLKDLARASKRLRELLQGHTS